MTSTFNRQLSTALALFFLLFGAYWLTYRGFALSQDELFIFDSTESFVRRGDFYRTYEFYKFHTGAFGPNGEPWGALNQEPLTSILVAPFFWLGQTLESVGTMHVTWLFNSIVTALTGVSIYIGAGLLGYSRRVALMAAVAFGLGTLAWPYSRHLFREPVMAFFTWWAFVGALMTQRALQPNLRVPTDSQPFIDKSDRNPGQHTTESPRAAWRHGVPWGVLMTVSFILAFLTKAVSLLLLPGLLILLLPQLRHVNRRWLLLAGLAAVVMVGAVAGVFLITGDALSRYSLGYWRDQLAILEVSFLWESFLGYQISPARSLWLHSPVLLLGLVGMAVLLRRGEWRLPLAGLAVLIPFSASYGIAHMTSWWGSWGWGPRYMLPLTPLLILWVLPALAAIEKPWQRFSFWGLVGVGAALQLLGMAVPLPNYYTDLNRAGLLTDWATQPRWAAYNWTWEWSPLRYHLERLDFSHLDVAWRFAQPGWIAPALALAMMLLAAVWLVRGGGRVIGVAAFAVLTGVLLAAVGAGLVALRDDPRYIDEWTDVRALVEQLNAIVPADAPVFIDREQYMPIFMNNFKPAALTIGLPYSPGENYGNGPELISDSLIEQITPLVAYTLDYAARFYDDVWLVVSSSPFETEKLRPLEHYMVQYYYPVESLETSQRARAIRFHTIYVPEGDPAEMTDLVFNEALALIGYTLPRSVFSPGEIVPVSLVWSPVEPLPDDYNVSVQIATLDGFPLAQRDGQPQATFGAMTQWEAGARYTDNHGLQLPADIPPGEYAVQVVVYRWQDGVRLALSDGQNMGQDVAQIARITVE
ncbi:MAG: hypothetical protein OHK0046_09540 [Anaerolineae bacterium]